MPCDPTGRNEKRVNGELRRLETEGAISKKCAAALRVMGDSSRPPLFYGRVKLHKEGEPLRPIVSAVGSCTYKVAKAVARAIMSYGRQVESYTGTVEIWWILFEI